MRGYEHYNFPAFDRYAGKLQRNKDMMLSVQLA